jgi:hypothetical protein
MDREIHALGDALVAEGRLVHETDSGVPVDSVTKFLLVDTVEPKIGTSHLCRVECLLLNFDHIW